MDRNIDHIGLIAASNPSPPARVAWIETCAAVYGDPLLDVATREGGVDRNINPIFSAQYKSLVATREGGVDRNRE